jgi:hypothetical protein
MFLFLIFAERLVLLLNVLLAKVAGVGLQIHIGFFIVIFQLLKRTFPLLSDKYILLFHAQKK